MNVTCRQEGQIIEPVKGSELDLELKGTAPEVELKHFKTTRKTISPAESEVENPLRLYYRESIA